MPAREKTLEPKQAQPQSVGIIAGGGDIPIHLANRCRDQGIKPFVVVIKGQANPDDYSEHEYATIRPGAAGTIFKTLKSHDIHDMILVGKIRRPSIMELKPDLKTAEFFAKLGLKALGDDSLLKSLRAFLEKEGFTVHGAHKFMPEILAPSGIIGQSKPNKTQSLDIQRGVEILKTVGALDIGQAIIMQQGHVLGIEAAEGTDELIKRCAPLQRKGSAAVLVKMCKPDQDRDLDLPTIGMRTIENAKAAKLSGIAVHTRQSFIHDLENVKKKADAYKIFLVGTDF